MPAIVAIADPMAAAIAEALASGVEDGVLDKRDAAAIAAFYQDRGDQPVWIVDGRFTPAALDLMARIERADEDGLDPAAYRLPWKDVGLYFQSKPGKIARSDLELSQAVALYARRGLWRPADALRAQQQLRLRDLAARRGRRPRPGLRLGRPGRHARRLQSAAARVRRPFASSSRGSRPPMPSDTRPMVPEGALLKPGMSDPRVPVIRDRLELSAGDHRARAL